MENRCFVDCPHEVKGIEENLDSWLGDLHRRIATGTFRPQPCEIIEVPKGGGLIRPAARLELVDHTVYNALIEAFAAEVILGLGWSHRRQELRYVPFSNPTGPQLFRPWRDGWFEWRDQSLARIEKGAQYVLFADVSGFYDNIDLRSLERELRTLGVDAEVLAVLFRCLHHWAQPRGGLLANRGAVRGL